MYYTYLQLCVGKYGWTMNITVTSVQGRGWWSLGYFPKLHKYIVVETFI